MGCFKSQPKPEEDINKRMQNLLYQGGSKKDEKSRLSGGMYVQTYDMDPFINYELLKLVGEGSFAKVYRVMNKENKIIRAMKIISSDKIKIMGKTEDFINEINLVKGLDHPNINKIYEVYNYSNNIHVVTELCTGGELFDYLMTNGRQNEKICAGILKQLISAVNFYQGYGIIHGDIKAENILIESKEDLKNNKINIKLIDFGLASKLGNMKDGKRKSITNSLGPVMGTISYLPPEAFSGDSSMKSDMWGIGCLMYFILQGKLPFRADTNDELIKKIKNCEYELMSNISFDAKDLLQKLLEKDRSKRISAKEALTHRFITQNSIAQSRSSLGKDKIQEIMSQVNNYKISKKLQEIFLGFIVFSLDDHPEIKELKNLFQDFDIDGDGRLTKEELVECFKKYKSENEAIEKVDQIMNNLDTDHNGFIECHEFVRASIDPKILVTEENLIRVFKVFDKDMSGKLETKEIASVIAKDMNLEYKDVEEMMKEVDLNGDGELSYSEFKKILASIFYKN